MDLVCYVLSLFPSTLDPIRDPKALALFLESEGRFRLTTVRQLIDIIRPGYSSKKDKLTNTLYKEWSVWSALEKIVRSGVRSQAVVNENGEVHGIITQSMLIGWLYNNLDSALRPISHIPVTDIPAATDTMAISIVEHEPAIKAFKLMADKRVSGVSIVNEKGELTNVISIRDLRGMAPTAEHFLRLFHPVVEFKREVRSMFPTKTPIWPDLFLVPSDTLRTAITMMDEDRVHRLIVVRSALTRSPVRVLSQTDILHYVLGFALGRPVRPS